MSEIRKSTIIKLRQEEAEEVINNGTYNINLSKPVLLEEGDTCTIKTSILDSTVESTILVQEDIVAELGIGKYIRNYDQPNTGDLALRKFTNKDSGPTGATADNLCYTLGRTTIAGANDYTINKLTVFPQHKHGIHDMGNLTLTYEYLDFNNQSQKWSTFMGLHVQQNHPNGFDINVNVNSRNGTWIFQGAGINLHDYKISSIAVSKSKDPVAAGGIYMTPDIKYVGIQIPAGRYTPGEIASLVTDRLSLNQPTGNDGAASNGGLWPVDGDVLDSLWRNSKEIETFVPPATQYLVPRRAAEGNGGLGPITQVMTQDASDDASNRWIGTNQISLTFDDNLKKLAWDIMHFPVYVSDPGNPTGPAIPGVVFDGGIAATSYSGIFFTSMTPDSFWNKQLGFGSMTVDWNHQSETMEIDSIEQIPYRMNPQFGSNTTESFNGLDLVVQHTATSTKPPPSGTAVDVPPVATGLTLPIIATREFDIAINDEGYYLVEIGFKLPQNMISGSNGSIGARNNNKVQSIMGKYFTSGNFLQDTGQGSIIYEHYGEPQLITDLQVSIRRPDGSMPDPTELGISNSVFLEIVKTVVIDPSAVPDKK